MSTPNPLIPQGTFQAHANKGASNVRIAVATIVAIHVVFFGGLLLQGCKRDTKNGGPMTAETNPAASDLSLPPRESASLYYSNVNNLPLDTGALTASSAPAASTDTLTYATSTATPMSNRETVAPPAFNNSYQSTTTPQTVAPSHTPEVAASSGATSEYTVVRGDTYSHIASAKGVTVDALKAANPGVEPRKIRPGMKLQIPAAAPVSASTKSSVSAASADAGGSDLYTVRQGDNLTRIASAHGITVRQLRDANNLKTSSIRIGQKLKIPASTKQTTNNTGAPSI